MINCKQIDKHGICRMKGCYAQNHKCFGEDMCKCREPMSNADHIRAMSDEELARYLSDVPSQCEIELNWLKQPYQPPTNEVDG